MEDQKLKAITSPALIKGVFRELAALRKPLLIRAEKFSGSSRISIVDDFSRLYTKDNIVKIEDISVLDKEITASFELDSIYYSCVLTGANTDKTNEFLLPAELTPEQRRRKTRSDLQSLSRQPIVVEARGANWRAYGYLKDSDQGYLTAKLSFFSHPPKKGESVRLRAYNQQKQVLSTAARIQEVRSLNEPNNYELLLDPYGEPPSTKPKRRTRQTIKTLTFLELFWPDQDGLRIRIEVTNVNPTGFSGKIAGNQKELPPKGAICRIGSSEINAQLLWSKEEKLGFDLSINERQALSSWSSWIDEWHLKVLNRTPQARQQARIASILIRSGYLRDFKASAFSSTPDLLSLIPNNKETKTWLKRFLRGSETDIDAHISFARCTDSSWIIQELGNSAVATRVGTDILNESIEDFYTQELPYISPGTTLLALFDPLSKFNQKYWISKENRFGIQSYETRLINIKATKDLIKSEFNQQNSEYKTIKPSTSNWPSVWSKIRLWANERTLLGFGIRSDDYSSPELRQSLAQSGYYLERSIAIIQKSEETMGIAITLGMPTFSNLNATTNHLWILVKDINDWKPALAALLDSQSQLDLSGLTEAVIASENLKSENLLENNFPPEHTKRRKLFFIPMHKLIDFVQNDGEEEND